MKRCQLLLDTDHKGFSTISGIGAERPMANVLVRSDVEAASVYDGDFICDDFGSEEGARNHFLENHVSLVQEMILKRDGEEIVVDISSDFLERICHTISLNYGVGDVKNCVHFLYRALGIEDDCFDYLDRDLIVDMWEGRVIDSTAYLGAGIPIGFLGGDGIGSCDHLALSLGNGYCVEKTGKSPWSKIIVSNILDVKRVSGFKNVSQLIPK